MLHAINKSIRRLKSDPELDFTSYQKLGRSIRLMLLYEKDSGKLKIGILVLGLFLTIIMALIAIVVFDKEFEQVLVEGAFSVLLLAIAAVEATESQMGLHKTLKTAILSSVPAGTLQKKYLKLLFKILKTQSFPNEEA